MKYEFMRVQSSINYLKTVSWYRSHHLKTTNQANLLTGLYKSKNFLVVNKPYDLVMYNFTKNKEKNLLSMLADIYPFHYDTRIQGGFRVLHRLDSVTSGAVCVPLNDIATRKAVNAFKQQLDTSRKHGVVKKYLSLVYGHIKEQNEFEIRVPIGDDSTNYGHLRCTSEDLNGVQNQACINQESAITKVKVLEYGKYKDKDCTKVMLELLTGRRHQLRVHLKYLGYPVVGDLQYGIDDFDTYRTMLHSYYFKINWRKWPENIEITAPDPFLSEIDVNWRPETIINKIN